MLIEHIIQKFFKQDFCYLIGSKPKVVLFQDSLKRAVKCNLSRCQLENNFMIFMKCKSKKRLQKHIFHKLVEKEFCNLSKQTIFVSSRFLESLILDS